MGDQLSPDLEPQKEMGLTNGFHSPKDMCSVLRSEHLENRDSRHCPLAPGKAISAGLSPAPFVSAGLVHSTSAAHTYLCPQPLHVRHQPLATQTDLRLILSLLRTQEEPPRIIFMRLIIGFLSLPFKVFIGTLNPLFNTCVYTVYIYSIFLVAEYCTWACILEHCNHIFLWVFFPVLLERKERFNLTKQMEVD